jgi:hypothetical protein
MLKNGQGFIKGLVSWSFREMRPSLPSTAAINHEHPLALTNMIFCPGRGLPLVAGFRITSFSSEKIRVIQTRVINID